MCKHIRLGLLLAGALSLAGCYEGSNAITHEPGVYKGKTDPLLAANASARAEQLKARFQGIQTDR